ncbi:helix-turn-helix transcriptional regulator [Nonomuraea sp. NPDC048901]|uniref:helix-turn-helix domain-containing protein n=1 Tax=unclassified Nonomuraea TaxID=2593643 RepID=UPI0033DB5EA9
MRKEQTLNVEVNMAAGSSPTVRRRRLASELRRLRKESGLTSEAVAIQLEYDQSWVSRIESGRRGIRIPDLKALLDVYGITDQAREELLQLARQARQRGWWHTYVDVIPDWFQIFVGLEAEASELRRYDTELVPGLLQTADYYRAYLRVAPMPWKPEEVDRMIEFRRVRQERITTGSLRLWAIMNEAVIRRHVASRQTMKAQLNHLIEMSETPNVTLQVLPFAAGPHPAMDGGFVIIGFPEANDPDVIYQESQSGSLYMEESALIDRYNVVFNHLMAKADDPDRTRDLLISAAKEA